MSSGNPSYKPSEGKREEFRKYLEKNGVMDALTKVLVNLYEEVDKPEDALEYIRDKLAVIAGLETHKELQLKLTEATDRIKDLESQLEAAGTAEEKIENVESVTEQPTDQPPAASDENEPPSAEDIQPEDNPDVEQ